MKESKFVKTKIFAGYAILIAVCVLSVGYVYRTVVRFSTPDGSYSLLHTKRSVAGQTLYHLYQAESYGQLMIAGYQSYESRYKRELRTVRGLIDSLRGLTAAEDSLQTMRLDSIVRLLADKERRTMSLRRTIRSAATSSLLDKNIRELIGPADSAAHGDSVVVRAADTVASRVVVQDTVTVPRRKRKFFRRFADLFSPPKEEAGMIISRHERVVDSLPAPEVKDTIAVVLRTLQDRVTSDRIGIYDRAWNEGMRLRYSNELVNTKIYRLIMDFEAEDTAFLMNRFEQTEAIRRRSSLTLGVIAVAAVVLMLLFVGILWRDINRSNRYRRALERANRDNEALLAAREKLMLAITHDIKAPLGSVMGYIDLLSRLTGDKREELYLHNMKESSEHLLALVNSLLDFYRLDINKVDVDKVAFCPAQLFETIRAGFAAQAGAKGIGLTLDVEPAAGREVAGDPFRIRQIADNLISNALKFTDEGSVTIRVDVVQGRLVFSVRDTGRGIGREEKERIFQEFVRLRSAQGVDGFGLGLSIVDRLVKLLKGTISLESRLGEGSKFIVSIPVGPVSGGEGRKLRPAEACVPAVRGGVKALLIDDDPLQLEMTAAMCRQAGVGAECCQYPEYAAKLVADGGFDVVLTDIQMPSADGFSVLAAVRGVNSALPVVAVSARGELEAGDFSDRGFAGCLRKPFTAGRRLRRGKGPKRRGCGRRGEERRCGNCRRRGRTRQCGEACRQEGSGRCGGQCGGGFGGRCEFRPPDGLCGRRCGSGARDSGILRRTERRELPAARRGARQRRHCRAESRGAQDAADLHDAGGGRSRRDAAHGRKLGRSVDRRPARRDRRGGGKYPRDCRGSAKKGIFALSMERILIIDDDITFALMLKTWLSKKGFRTETAASVAAARTALAEGGFSLVLSDMRLPDEDGIALLQWMSGQHMEIPVIVMTSYAEIQNAVRCMKLGARDYVAKPVNPDELLKKIREALDVPAAGSEKPPVPAASAKKPREERPNYIEGRSDAAQRLYEYVRLVAPTNMSVLVTGASGTGKEHVAQLIHRESRRAGKPFVAVDCGAIGRELAASEFFGHVKGSFTGAVGDKTGAFEAANGGTLFLDEVGNLSYETQVQLLRALQERRIRPVGGSREIPVDIRLIAATNEDLEAAIARGAFRADLYHRINEFTLRMPELRQMRGDIMLFADFFLDAANRELDKRIVGFDPQAAAAMTRYDWPGNLRQMKNAVMSATLLCTGDYITCRELPAELSEAPETPAVPLRNPAGEEEQIRRALAMAGGNKSQAAKLLGIDRKTLYNKLHLYGIE